MRWPALLPVCAGVSLYALGLGAAHGSVPKLHARAAVEHGWVVESRPSQDTAVAPAPQAAVEDSVA
ncbi:MAG: hypothetical protein ACREKI_02700, partial [Gemmatimonadota bacterium]